VLFHGSDYSGVFIVEQRYYSVNAFEIFVRCDGAQGALEKKDSGLFKVSSLSPVGWESSRKKGANNIFLATRE